MNIKYIKALRDLKINPRRTFLAVFALVLGIWGVGTVLVANYILTHDLKENFQRTRPPHLTLKSDDFHKLDLEKLLDHPKVEAAEFRDLSIHRIEIKPDKWIPLILFGLDEFESSKVGKIFPESGKIIPDKGSILLERNGKLISNLEIGSKPKIRFGKEIIQVPISGICFDPAQAPATQDHVMYAYTDKQTYANLTGLPANTRLIMRLREVFSIQDVQAFATQFQTDLQAKGVQLNQQKIPPFNEHPHQWQLNTILFVIGTIGFLALGMGAVLISQLMRALIAGQVRQIGMMKSLGATKGQVFQIYVAMLVTIGIIAGALAVPAAVGSGTWFSYFVAGILNFNISTTVPFSIYFILFLAGLSLPLLLSLPVLWKGTNTSVKAALNDYGISSKRKKKDFLTKAYLIKRMPGTFILAFRNSIRNSRRLSVTVLTLALGVAIFSTGFNVRKSLWDLLNNLKNELRYDVQIGLTESISKESAVSPFREIPGIKGIHTWNGKNAMGKSRLLSTQKGIGITSLPPDTELIKPKIIEGRWIQTSQNLEIAMNQQAWQRYQFPEVGQNLDLIIGDSTVNVLLVGVLEQFDKGRIFVNEERYNEIFNPKKLVNTITFVGESHDYESIFDLKREIERAILPSGLNVGFVQANEEKVTVIYAHLNIILSTILLLSFLVLLVSSVGMASATLINIGERTREIGVMRAIGATPKMVYSLFAMEGLIIGMGSIGLGLLLSYPLSKVAAVFFGNLMLGEHVTLESSFSLSGLGITLIVTFVFTWLASRIPAQNALARISIKEALAYE